MNRIASYVIAFGLCAGISSVSAQTTDWRGLGRDAPDTGNMAVAAGNECNERIMGGECAPRGAWPWQVALFLSNNKQFFCGGTVIAKRWVLTAAHCVLNKPANNIHILEGSTNIASGGRAIAVAKIVMHNYNTDTKENDIALLYLAEDAMSPPIVVASPRDKELEQPGRLSVATGWGLTHPVVRKKVNGVDVYVDGQTGHPLTPEQIKTFVTKYLMQVDLPIATEAACKETGRVSTIGVVDERVLCAGGEAEKDTCNGDSGGPLLTRDGNNNWRQIGIVSWGLNGCGMKGLPGVYTRVSAFEPWLRQQTGVQQDEPSTETQDVVANATGLRNPAKLSVAFVQGSHLRAGQSVQARVTTERPGYLLLLDVSADGKVTQLYPSELSLRSPTGAHLRPIKTHMAMHVPDPANPYAGFEFTIDPPAGKGQLVAVLTRQPIKELRIPESPKTFTSRGLAMSFLSSIVSAINRDIHVTPAQDQITSIATFNYIISE